MSSIEVMTAWVMPDMRDPEQNIMVMRREEHYGCRCPHLTHRIQCY